MFNTKKFKNVTNFNEIVKALKSVIPNNITLEDIIFVCIGTDRSTGDAFGPLIGTNLVKMGYNNVLGTLHDPVHAVNLVEKISTIPEDKFIIAIDACLGKVKNIGTFTINEGSVKPGAGVNKDLPEVGDVAITGVVNVSGFMEFFVLQNTKLSLVVDMAEEVSDAISFTLPISDIFGENAVSN